MTSVRDKFKLVDSAYSTIGFYYFVYGDEEKGEKRRRRWGRVVARASHAGPLFLDQQKRLLIVSSLAMAMAKLAYDLVSKML